MYPWKRPEFVFEFDFLGMVILCPCAVTLRCWRVKFFFPLVYIIGVNLLHRLTRVLFLSFSFVVNFIFIFIIFLAGRNNK